MKKLNEITKTGKGGFHAWLLCLLLFGFSCSALLFAQSQGGQPAIADHPVARVNGVAITETELQDEMETLYPSNSAHGGLRPDKLKGIRSKALEELVVQELAYQQAVKARALIPMVEVQAECSRLRNKYGVQAFDRSLQARGLTRREYLKKLQRRMTLERLTKQKVYWPSRVSLQALRAYYQKNLGKFQRPEQIHARLILAAVDPASAGAKPQEESKAKEKIEKVYQELRAGKDFAALAAEYSDDFYKVKGGDLGWAHRGRLEPEFEKVAITLAPGQFSPPFRTPYGYNLMKVEGREPARQMKFEEVRAILKAELEQEKMLELRQAWVDQLKKGARIEVLETEPATSARAAH